MNVNAATMITINKNEQYSFLTPENDYKQSIFYIPNKDNYEDNVVAYCVAGAQNEFIDVSLVYHKGNEEIENIPLNPMLYNGYITDSGNDKNMFDGCDAVMAGDIHKRQELKSGEICLMG